MGQYMILIYEDPKSWETADQETWDQAMKGHQVFGESNAAVIRHGEALEPPSTATAVLTDADGKFVVSDGPFAETKEALGGFYLVEAADLDEAIALAKQVPHPFGGLEIRPVRVFDKARTR
jgi:hypothetical protein